MGDVVGFVVMLAALLGLVLLAPNYLGEPDNFIPANPMVTPPHIVPEWYFLFAYAILRSIPNKLGGVLGLFRAILVLASLPALHYNHMKGIRFYLILLHADRRRRLASGGALRVGEAGLQCPVFRL